MNPWLLLLAIFFIIIYVLVRIARPITSQLSQFELERRAGDGDAVSSLQRQRLKIAPFVEALRWVLSLLLVLSIEVSLAGAVGGVAAFILTLVVVIAIAWFERAARVQRRGERLYARIESKLTALYGRRKLFFFLPIVKPGRDARINSEPELLHLLEHATFLEPDRRALIHSALEFTGLSVKDAMSGRKSIKSVEKSEILGPIVIDELYKTGKQAFVVVDGDIDTVVGVLLLDRLTSLDLKDSPSALKAMSPEVHFIDADNPITDALSYLRSSKAPFLVVQRADGTTAGLLTMDNILRCLFEQ